MSRLGSALNRSMGGGTAESVVASPNNAAAAAPPASRAPRKRVREDPGALDAGQPSSCDVNNERLSAGSPSTETGGAGPAPSGGGLGAASVAAAAAATAASGTTAKPSQVIVPVPVPVAWVGDRIGNAHYGAAYFGGRVYHVNDTVLLQSGTSVPYVCRIERMLERGGRKLMFVRWFFRAPDVPDVVGLLKRQPFCEELFMTDVVEENEVRAVARGWRLV